MTHARWRLLSVALVGAAVVVSVPWLFGYLLPQTSSRLIALAGLSGFSPYGVFAIAVFAWACRRWAALALVATLLAAQVLTVGSAYVGDGTIPAEATVLRLMTANLYFGTADVAEIVRLVRVHRIDVLALEELSPDAVSRLQAAGLQRELPYGIDHSAPGAAGTGLWSRLAITAVPAAPAGFNVAAADVIVGTAKVRVRAFHPVTPLPTPARWQRSFAVMRSEVGADKGIATVLLGDFNATVHHRELRHLMGSRWRDAAEVDGAGLVRTWQPRSHVPAILDLDHVLIDRGMTAAGYRTAHIRGSDHRAVIVIVGLPVPT